MPPSFNCHSKRDNKTYTLGIFSTSNPKQMIYTQKLDVLPLCKNTELLEIYYGNSGYSGGPVKLLELVLQYINKVIKWMLTTEEYYIFKCTLILLVDADNPSMDHFPEEWLQRCGKVNLFERQVQVNTNTTRQQNWGISKCVVSLMTPIVALLQCSYPFPGFPVVSP